ncbi:MAG: DUF6476 family protein [Rhodobacter sp.]|nr:DUF6476 family protein [Rhodobacter sp.]
MDEVPEEIGGEVKSLRLLRILVTVLLVVMIGGFLFLIGLFAMRLSGPPEREVEVPAAIRLEPGQQAVAFTQGSDWIAVVTEADEILIFDRETGELRQKLRIETQE